MTIKVNRKTLYLAIPIEIETDDGIETAYLHAAPLDAALFNEFSSDLASTIGKVFDGNPLIVACEYLGMVESHIMETRDEGSAKARIARLNKILLSEIVQKGTVISSFTDFAPLPVGEAMDAGIITADDLELAESKYLFFSRAVRVSRSLVAQFAGTYRNSKDYGSDMKSQIQSTEQSISYPVLSENATSAEKATQSYTEPLTASPDSQQASSPAQTGRKVRAIGQSFGN